MHTSEPFREVERGTIFRGHTKPRGQPWATFSPWVAWLIHRFACMCAGCRRAMRQQPRFATRVWQPRCRCSGWCLNLRQRHLQEEAFVVHLCTPNCTWGSWDVPFGTPQAPAGFGVRAGELREAAEWQAPTSLVKTIHHGTEPFPKLRGSRSQELELRPHEPGSPTNFRLCFMLGTLVLKPQNLSVKGNDWGWGLLLNSRTP